MSVCTQERGFVCQELMVHSPVEGWSAPAYAPLRDFNLLGFAESDAKFCMISGSERFVFQVLTALPAFKKFICSLDLDQRPTARLSSCGYWFSARHSDHGGVTSGIWWFGTNDSSVTPPPTTRSALRLGHVLSDIKGGTPVSPPSDHEAYFDSVTYVSGTRSLHAGGLLPIKAPHSKIICMGVFSPTKWVERVLTVHELARCLDLGESSLQAFEDKPIHAVRLKTLPFLMAAPRRLLAAIAKPWLTSNQEEEGASTLEGGPIWHPMPKPGLRSILHEPNEGSIASERGRPSPTPPPPATIRTMSSLWEEEPDETFGREKAAKNDDAGIDTQFWDRQAVAVYRHDPTFQNRWDRFHATFNQDPCSSLRGFLLRRWRCNVRKSFCWFMKQESPNSCWCKPVSADLEQDWEANLAAGRDCIRRSAHASWWDWDHGSRLFFWRWPKESRLWARDGHPILAEHQHLPTYTVRQPPEPDTKIQQQVRDKLTKIRSRGYVVQGSVKSLTPYFTVPKGDGDVRLVFDGTRSLLNSALWAPPFVLPTINSLLRAVDVGTWMADIDIGEMFYNFFLDPDIQPHCGIDIKPYFNLGTWERWNRCVMGIKSSPHGCTKMEMLGDEVAKGDYANPSNPFAFTHVRLNLPGSPQYSPSLPWVSKFNARTNAIANDVKTYVDDKRVTGASKAACLRATRRAASMLSYLGMQDACRKRVSPSQRAGAWAGSVCHTDDGKVSVLVTVDKWLKARSLITELLAIASTTNTFDFKMLESARGFLIYVVRTYPAFNSYLKGIHLTLDSWRPGRRDDGWKDIGEYLPSEGESAEILPPASVVGVPRLSSDLRALTTLFNPLNPPR